METRVSEIADGIYRLSTFVPDGPRAMFPAVSSAFATGDNAKALLALADD